MRHLSLPLAAAVAGVLLWAGLEKFRSGAAFAQTLAALGFGPRLRTLMRLVVPAAEVVVAVGLLVTPASIWPRIGVGLLAMTFATAGVIGLRRNERIACSCFGGTGSDTLGWRQLALLPAWLLAVFIVWQADPHWSALAGLQYLAALIVLVAVIPGVGVVAAWHQDAGYRSAIEEAVIRRPGIVAYSSAEGDAS